MEKKSDKVECDQLLSINNQLKKKNTRNIH